MTRLFLALYRAAIRALPAALRHEYGAVMMEQARLDLEEAAGGGSLGVPAACLRLAADWVVTLHREWIAEIRGHLTVSRLGLLGEFTRGWRGLFRSPGFASLTAITLALGIGAVTALFAVVNGVLLQPLDFEDSHELVGVWHTAPGVGLDEAMLSGAMVLTYQQENRVFQEMGAWNTVRVSVTENAEATQLDARAVTAGLFPLLGVAPEIGRGFTESDDTPGAPATVVLGAEYWTRRFGADPDVVGQILRVDGVPREVIGVLPSLHQLESDVYIPLQLASGTINPSWGYRTVGRLRPGIELADASADVTRMIPLIPQRFPAFNIENVIPVARLAPSLRPMKDDFVGDIGGLLWVLLGAAGIVLVVSWANVTNLFLVRVEGRQDEVEVRMALGAGRIHIARHVLIESSLLVLVGAVAGVAMGHAGVRLLRWMEPEDLPRLSEIAIDSEVLTVWVGVSVLTAVVFGCLGVIRAGRVAAHGTLRGRDRGGTAGPWRHRTRDALVIAQLALALVLLTSSGLMVRSVRALRAVDPGFENPEGVLSFRAAIPATPVLDSGQVLVSLAEVYERLEALPGVASVGLSTSITMDGHIYSTVMNVEGQPPRVGDQTLPVRHFKWVAGSYFETMGNPTVAGRAIGWRDVWDDAPVALVTENLAREVWGSPGAAIGARIASGGSDGGRWREVIGVVGDIRDDGADEPATASVFLPLSPSSYLRGGVGFVVRADGIDPGALTPLVRSVVREVDPSIPLHEVRTLDEILDESMARTAFALVLLGIAAACTLVLGLVGIYAVIAYVVSQRTREIGVRMAIGADAADVRWMVLRKGARLMGVGIAVGLLVAIGLGRVISSLLYGVAPTDPFTLAAAALVLGGVALVACYVPAAKASRTQAMDALRMP